MTAEQERAVHSRGGTRVGALRPSQLLHSFGIGALADLPHLSVMVMGLDFWDPTYADLISEDRLLTALRVGHGSQLGELRKPPYKAETANPFEDWSRVGVPAAVFPRWLRCTNPNCRRLSPVERGLFQLKVNPYRPDQAHYEHNCSTRGKAPSAVPARFLVACRNGHLDDFPWERFVHRGEPCGNPLLKLVEHGTTGEAGDVAVRCEKCDKGRTMAEAFGQRAAERLPRCRGRRPHLADFDERACEEDLRTLVLGASNLWFPATSSVLSIPTQPGALAQAVEEQWALLEAAATPEILDALLKVPQLATLKQFDRGEVMAAIDAKRSGSRALDDTALDLLGPEWDVFGNPERFVQEQSQDFHLRIGQVPDGPLLKGRIEQLVLAERLREVVALTGFTRIDLPGDQNADGEPPEQMPLTRAKPHWFPCTETRGEGLFLRFPTDEIGRWEQDVAGSDRRHEFEEASGKTPWATFPGMRYVLLHSLSHALMREVALECGYGAASIRERLYADDKGSRNWAGILLYTAAPDSEGTLGGLVSLGEPEMLGRLLTRAIENAELCSADPMCSEHTPGDVSKLHGAACHACLFAAETSCERGNRYLDRSLLVDTFTTSSLGYFTF